MIFRSLTLADEPFNFDVLWRFPKKVRDQIRRAFERIEIQEVSEISSLEEKMNKQLNEHGFIWDKNDDEGKCKLWKQDFNNSVDFYNPVKKIAIEVEKTEVKRVLHDILKMINGTLTFVPKIEFGVLEGV